MTKKNSRKIAARALKETVGGSYQAHLRELGGGGSTGDGASGFFQPIADAIRTSFPGLSLALDLPMHRIFVRSEDEELVVCAATNEPPTWPVSVLLPEAIHGVTWECDNVDDVLTVLRYRAAHPSRVGASVNEIRDEFENDAKHRWLPVLSANPGPLVTTFQCVTCEARLRIGALESVEEVARIAFANWRKQRSGRAAPPRTLSRSMEVPAVPPRCPGSRALGPEQAFTFEGVMFTYRMQSPTAAVGSYPDGPGLPTAFSMCLDTKQGKPNALISCMVRDGSREARGLLALAFHVWPETAPTRTNGSPYAFVPRRYTSLKKFAYIEVFDGDRLAGILRPPMAGLIGEHPHHWRLDCAEQDHMPGHAGLLDAARAFVGTEMVTAFSPWAGWKDQGNTETFPADVDWRGAMA